MILVGIIAKLNAAERAAVAAIVQELLRAKEKHPAWPKSTDRAVGIITEEALEVVTASNDLAEGAGGLGAVAIEVSHVGAMAIRFLANDYPDEVRPYGRGGASR